MRDGREIDFPELLDFPGLANQGLALLQVGVGNGSGPIG
jgi:hypothetical protein